MTRNATGSHQSMAGRGMARTLFRVAMKAMTGRMTSGASTKAGVAAIWAKAKSCPAMHTSAMLAMGARQTAHAQGRPNVRAVKYPGMRSIAHRISVTTTNSSHIVTRITFP